MRQFLKVASGIDVLPIMLELNRAPHLWDQNTTRTTYENTPHGQSSDIWVRFRPAHEIKGLDDHRTEYRCAYWPAWHELPSLRPLIRALKNTVDATELGSLLITRLPPGAEILPHSDRGSWAAEFYNTKLHVTLSGTSRSFCDGEAVLMQTGECWVFDNLRLHSVENVGETDRIVLIVSLRCDP